MSGVKNTSSEASIYTASAKKRSKVVYLKRTKMNYFNENLINLWESFC